jgi:phosphoglycerate-specific signal transduction histidine kinase
VDAERLRTALHDLSQPLTALECILYLQMITAQKTIPDGTAAAEVSNTMREALEQCSRMMAVMRTMRDCLETETGSV